MSCKRDKAYYVQLEDGIAEMEATIEHLRAEILSKHFEDDINKPIFLSDKIG